MCGELNRYFIELFPADGTSVPRYLEAETRRAQAARFLETVGEWLEENDLSDKVARLAITALGQVQITCEAGVIHQIRDNEALNVANIRSSNMLAGLVIADNTPRWNEAH